VRALDIGCGAGVLTRELRSVSQRVVGIDLDAPSIELARAQGGEGVEYVIGDFVDHSFEPASFQSARGTVWRRTSAFRPACEALGFAAESRSIGNVEILVRNAEVVFVFATLFVLSCAAGPACKAAQQPYPELTKANVSWSSAERSADFEACLESAADTAAADGSHPGTFCEMRLRLRQRALSCMQMRGWQSL